MPANLTVAIDSDNYLTLSGLVNNIAPSTLISDAVVQATLRDRETDTPITGQTWPLTLTPVGATPGSYRGQLESDLELSASQKLTAEVIVASGGLTLTIRAPVTAVQPIGA